MKYTKAKGSITLFAGMTFMLVLQCIFTILEGGRMLELRKVAALNADAGIESVFAEYCIPLWEDYHLLACDLANDAGDIDLDRITECLDGITTSNFAYGETTLLSSPRINFLRIEQDRIEYDRYTLLTDCQGRVFEAAVSAYMKQNLPYEAVNKIKDSYHTMKGVEKNDSYDSNQISNALDSLENAKKEAQNKTECKKENGVTDGDKLPDIKDIPEPPEENPLELVEEVQAGGILGQVLPAGTKISSKSVANKDLVSKRTRIVGKNPKEPSNNLTDKALVEQYLVGYMSNYVEPISKHALKYELEYILAGKSTDEENLKSTVLRIMATREAANFGYLMTDASKQAEAYSLALAIAGASANPAVIEAVKIGLLTSWAYCESVLDLRTLLSGERIPIVKTPATWTSTLSGMGEFLSGFAKAKSSAVGLNYTDYVGTMIMLQSVSTISYRTMDLQELTIRKKDGYQNFRMDQAMCNMDMTVYYTHNSLFFDKVSLISKVIAPYEIPEETTYTYLKY